ncbi:MAG TPA: VOC family protein [Acidobacteriaceae bacterium]|nr:VOC family protein [Acidobacteriaceae bacterium]
MIHIDHIAMGCVDLYEASDRLRRETGLGFYDGGWFLAFGIANKIFPLGGQTYIEIESIVNPHKVKPGTPPMDYFLKATSAGEDTFTGLCLGVDSMEELEGIAKRLKSTIPDTKDTVRVRSSGPAFVDYQTPAEFTWGKGLPNWYFFTDMTLHPSGQPVDPYPGLVRPMGISWIEMGGSEQEMTDWLGVPASTLPLKFNGRTKGIYAVAVKTEDGPEIVIRRKNAVEL